MGHWQLRRSEKALQEVGTLRSMKPNGLASMERMGSWWIRLLCALGFHTLGGFSSGYGAEWHDPSAY